MFVRFRQQRYRLQASLMESRRVAGTVKSEHIAALGSVGLDISIRDRITFWAALPGRFARLGNRIGADDLPKIYGALHARIPIVTPDDQRAVQEENAKDDEQMWDALRDMSESSVTRNKGLVAAAEKRIAEETAAAAAAAERVTAARERLDRLKRGESVAGGLGRKLDRDAMIEAMGLTQSEARDLMDIANLTEGELKLLPGVEEMDKAKQRAVRRILQQRQQ